MVEVLAVVVILAALAALAVPRLADATLSDASGAAAVKQFVSELRLARRRAIEHAASNPSGFQVHTSCDRYRTLDLGTGSWGGWTELPDGWSFGVGASMAAFDPYGGATGDTSFVLTGPETAYTVTIEAATGYVGYQESP